MATATSAAFAAGGSDPHTPFSLPTAAAVPGTTVLPNTTGGDAPSTCSAKAALSA